jgi:hypothetical protein
MENTKKKWFIEKYGKHHNYLELLGEFPSSYVPTIHELGLEKASFQACYKEMKKIEFKESVTMYLCLLSTIYLMFEWEKKVESHDSREGKNRHKMIFPYLDDACRESAADFRNATRLFLRYPGEILGSYIVKKYRKEFLAGRGFETWDSMFDVSLAKRFYNMHAYDSVDYSQAEQVCEGLLTYDEFKDLYGSRNVFERFWEIKNNE